MKTAVQKKLVSVREACEMLSLSKTGLYETMIKPGVLDSFVRSRERVITVESIDRYIEASLAAARDAEGRVIIDTRLDGLRPGSK